MHLDNFSICFHWIQLNSNIINWVPWIQLVCLTDSAFMNTWSKHSQGAWLIFAVYNEFEAEHNLGGVCHLLEAGSRKGSRVSKSTWSAELLAALQGTERTEVLAAWLGEIWFGAQGTIREQAHRAFFKAPLCTQLVVDCRGLFDSISAQVLGKVQDRGMLLWIACLRELYRRGWLEQIAWVPTESMISDSQTKWKDGLDREWFFLVRSFSGVGHMFQGGYCAALYLGGAFHIRGRQRHLPQKQ